MSDITISVSIACFTYAFVKYMSMNKDKTMESLALQQITDLRESLENSHRYLRNKIDHIEDISEEFKVYKERMNALTLKMGFKI